MKTLFQNIAITYAKRIYVIYSLLCLNPILSPIQDNKVLKMYVNENANCFIFIGPSSLIVIRIVCP